MYYLIDKKGLYERIYEQVSFVADDAYVEGGGSLYDSVILTEKDRIRVYKSIDDAVSTFVRRAFDICKYYPCIVTAQKKNASNQNLYYVVDENGAPTAEQSTVASA